MAYFAAAILSQPWVKKDSLLASFKVLRLSISVAAGTLSKLSVTNGAKVIYIRRLKSDPEVNLLS